MLDEGRLTDGQGRTVDFQNTVVLLTSNIGAMELLRDQERVEVELDVSGVPLSGGTNESGTDSFSSSSYNSRGRDLSPATRKAVMQKVKGTFSPEFLNRLDDIVVRSRWLRNYRRQQQNKTERIDFLLFPLTFLLPSLPPHSCFLL